MHFKPFTKVTRQNVQLSATLGRTIGILRCEGIPQFLSSLNLFPSSGLETFRIRSAAVLLSPLKAGKFGSSRQRAEHEFLPTRIADDHLNKRSETFSRQSMTEAGGEATVGKVTFTNP